jgi:hypothetical protein
LDALIAEKDIQMIEAYASSIITKVTQGDPLYVALALIAALIILGILIEVTFFVWRIVKRLALLGIIASSMYLFIVYVGNEFNKYGALEKIPPQTLAFAAAGLLVCLLALYISLRSLIRRARPAEEAREELEYEETAEKTTKRRAGRVLAKPPAPVQALTIPIAEKSLLSVLAYIIVGEFGVFSSITIAAPNPQVGMGFVGAFLVGALLFLRNTYADYVKGLKHLLVAAVFAVVLSIVLGHYWALIPAEKLLSIDYFGTSAAVAVVTGIAVSLLLGSKG